MKRKDRKREWRDEGMKTSWRRTYEKQTKETKGERERSHRRHLIEEKKAVFKRSD